MADALLLLFKSDGKWQAKSGGPPSPQPLSRPFFGEDRPKAPRGRLGRYSAALCKGSGFGGIQRRAPTRRTGQKMIGKTDFDFRPRDLAEGMFIDDQEVIRSGKRILEKEEQTVDPSGKIGCRLVTKLPMRDKQGNIDVAGLHAVFLAKQIAERRVAAFRLAEFTPQLRDLGARVLGGKPHRVAHMKQ